MTSSNPIRFVFSGGSSRDLAELAGRCDRVNLRVEIPPDAMGGASTLLIALGGPGAIAGFAAIISAWLQSRRAVVRVSRVGSEEHIELSASLSAKAVRQILNDLNAIGRAAESSD